MKTTVQKDLQRKNSKSMPFRQCAVTRERLPVDQLLRFCLSPDGDVIPDLKNRLPGRGVWISCNYDTIDRAAHSGILPRAFSRSTKTQNDLADNVYTLLERAALERLSLANKAGLIVAGHAKVVDAIRHDKATVLLHARDGAVDGREKISVKAKDREHTKIDCFNVEQLSLALGRTNVVHAAVRKGGACGSFLHAVDRLQRYRAPDAVLAVA